jgi:hypothetical protein
MGAGGKGRHKKDEGRRNLRAGPVFWRLSACTLLRYCFACSKRLLISSQLTVFHQAAR